LDGSITIRTFCQIENFISKFQLARDENNSAMLIFIAAHRWLVFRLEFIGSMISLGTALVIIIFNEKLKVEAGFVALVLMWTTSLSIILNFLMDSFSESEAAITSVERIHAMSQLPQENYSGSNKEIPGNSSEEIAHDVINKPRGWPMEGELEFRNVSMRYRENLPLTLQGISFRIPARKRCGIVGRTGSGKSSLTVALFRLVEVESGSIILDGVDLSHVPLSEVRGRTRSMYIVPQDSVLFSGTIRECLDPFNEFSDDDILEALHAVRMFKKGEKDALNNKVCEGGSNFSVGERQLLCMSRALLAKPKVLVMDEATACVDGETDKFIQKMLRSRFQDSTILTIAHRLDTIMDYDIILGIDDGKIMEAGSPQELLQNEEGLLSKLVQSMTSTTSENDSSHKKIE